MLERGEGHERVGDGAAGETQPGEHLREAAGHVGPEKQRLAEPFAE